MWALWLAFLLLQTPSQPGPAREGLTEYGRKNYARAVELLTPAMTGIKPGTALYNEAALALGQSYFLLGRSSDAIPWLEKRRENKSRPEIDYMLSQALLQTGDTVKARTVLGQLFHAAPDSAAAHTITARLLVRMARNKEALTELEAAVTADPHSEEGHLMLGEVALALAQPETALQHFRTATELSPGAPAAWLGLGEAHSRLEHWTEAIPALQKSIWLNPHNAQPYVALGKAYLRVKSYANAETMLREALKLDPQNTSAKNLLRQTNH